MGDLRTGLVEARRRREFRGLGRGIGALRVGVSVLGPPARALCSVSRSFWARGLLDS